MSGISDIFRQYHAAQTASQEQYDQLYQERAEATQGFYSNFFHRLVFDFGARFREERFRARLQENIERATGTASLHFIAIDGTCRREIFQDMITFFGGAYGARGEVSLADGSHRIRYKRWSLDHDVSMVAWVPVPFARLEEITREGAREQFLMTEEEKVNLSSVHVQVMQLAEVFLAYNTILSSRLDAPNLLLMDLSPSSLLASVAHSLKGVGLAGYPYDRRAVTMADMTIALAHPFSDVFGIPSSKRMDHARLLVAELHRSPATPLDLAAVSRQRGVPEGLLRRAADYLVGQGVLHVPAGALTYTPAMDVQQSWAYTRDLFQNICTRLFLRKDPVALQYDAPDERGVMRRRWMAPDDLGFLIGVGMRLLIEACWEKRILFYGIVKDSSSRYLTRNFLGVALEAGFYPELAKLKIAILPWTDRIFCETLPLIDEGLSAPWSTIEFDSAFMTLHRQRDEAGKTGVAGVQGRIVNQERLFARSLGQFFLRRDKPSPLMGHVVFLERLLSPLWDAPGRSTSPEEILIDTPDLGKFSVFAWRDRDQTNWGQLAMMYLLSVLTRNHFAEAVGYPDPLHKADWGAKTIGRRAAETIRAAAHGLACRPLSRTFRAIREGCRRR